eukprot:gene1879-biopygen1853
MIMTRCSPLGLDFNPLSPSAFLTDRTWSAVLMNDANTMSTFCSAPNFKSASSFSVTAGKSMSTFGRFTPLWLLIGAAFTTSQSRKSAPISLTCKLSRPSSMKISWPFLITFVMLV